MYHPKYFFGNKWFFISSIIYSLYYKWINIENNNNIDDNDGDDTTNDVKEICYNSCSGKKAVNDVCV